MHEQSGMTHSLPYAVNCSILLTHLPLLARPAAARAAGFDAIELWWPFAEPAPADAEIDALVRAIEDAGVRLVSLNFAAGNMAAGDRGLVSWPARRTEFRDNVDVVVGIGARLGTRAFNALYGNRIDGQSPHSQDDLAAENLALAASAVAGIGGIILIEPLSGASRYPIRTVDEARAVIDRVARAHGVDNLRVLMDLYHLGVNGEDVPAAIDRAAGSIGHAQIADAPGRGAPGTGRLPLPAWLSKLEQAGYRGYVSLEYASTDPDPFSWLPRSRRPGSSRPT